MPRPLTLLTMALCLLMFTREGATSGGGQIEITRDQVRLTVVTAHKIPMRGDEENYARHVTAWEKANRAAVEKIAIALERDVAARAKKLPLVANGFDAQGLTDLSTEGVGRGGDGAAGWRLTVELDPFPDGAEGAKATFILKTRPAKADVRAFSRDVEASVARALGRPVAAKVTYRAYWLFADPAAPSLVLSTVPLADLPAALQKQRWRPMGHEAFRRSAALVLTTQQQKFVTRNSAGFLLANPTAAKLEPSGALALQINGTYSTAAKVQPATKADALRLLRAPLDPALAPDAAKAARIQAADDLDFFDSLVPDLVD